MEKTIDRYFLKAQMDAYARAHGSFAVLECIAWFLDSCNGRRRSTFSEERLQLDRVERELRRVIGGGNYDTAVEDGYPV